MGFNINKVLLGGRVTKAIELRETESGKQVCSFTIAIDRRGTKDVSDFIDCVAWNKTAEFISTYFDKGSSIFVEGEINKRKYTNANGETRYITEVLVSNASFIDSPSGDQKSTKPVGEEDLPF